MTWTLKEKSTGEIFHDYTYTSRSLARQAAKKRMFGGNVTAVRFVPKTHTTKTKVAQTVKTQMQPQTHKISSTKSTARDTSNLSTVISRTGFFPLFSRWF